MAECAVHLPQFIIKRVGGVVEDGVHRVHHPPLCRCLQIVQFQPDHRAGHPYQIYWHRQPRCRLPNTLQPRTVHWPPLTFSSLLHTSKDLCFLIVWPFLKAIAERVLFSDQTRFLLIWTSIFPLDDKWGRGLPASMGASINS